MFALCDGSTPETTSASLPGAASGARVKSVILSLAQDLPATVGEP